MEQIGKIFEKQLDLDRELFNVMKMQKQVLDRLKSQMSLEESKREVLK